VYGRGELVWYWGRGTGRWGVWDRMCVDMEWGVEETEGTGLVSLGTD
jgi:hypothetical protein